MHQQVPKRHGNHQTTTAMRWGAVTEQDETAVQNKVFPDCQKWSNSGPADWQPRAFQPQEKKFSIDTRGYKIFQLCTRFKRLKLSHESGLPTYVLEITAVAIINYFCLNVSQKFNPQEKLIKFNFKRP